MINNRKERAIILARYIIATGATLRVTGSKFNLSKSTVQVEVSHYLKNVSLDLYNGVQEVLKTNFKEKHIRGGKATKKVWERLREMK